MSKKVRPSRPEATQEQSQLPFFQRYHLQRFAEIGMALSGEEDISRLMEMIVHEAREITNADAGTLYMLNDERTHLLFVVMQNETMDVFLGGVEGGWISMPPVPLYSGKDTDGLHKQNHTHVSAHVAHSAEIVNIPDVYQSDAFDFSGTRTYDQQSGYRSRSMLVIPMRNHEQDVIGVLQLLNAKNRDSGEVVAFSDDYVPLVASLASQAAVTLTRTRLIQGLTELLEAFIRSIARAIEEKSRYTGGHIARVSRLATLMAEQINNEQSGPFQSVRFSAHELEELRLAGWLHDIGKIITPEHIVDKSRKLETICDRGKLVDTRFELIARCLENDCLRKLLERQQAGAPAAELQALQDELQRQLKELQHDRQFVLDCNLPEQCVSEQDLARLRQIAAKTYVHEGTTRHWLEEEELENLTITKGTLNPHERRVMEDHAGLTWRMLSNLPFPKRLGRVAEYASQHHEKLDGSGYPFGLKSEQLSLQARIMAVADIFEALTARDRPYKKPMKLSQAIDILGDLKEIGHIDENVHDLLISSGLISVYASEELAPEQVDIPLEKGFRQPGKDLQQQELEECLKHPPENPQRQKPLLLVVDASQSSRMLLSYYLKDSPWDLDYAENGPQGLALLARKAHELVLADLDLRSMKGGELVQRIRSWERQHNLAARPVLFMTAPYFACNEKHLCASQGNGKILRPFGKTELLAFLQQHMP